MRYLKTNTAVIVQVGPFLDKTDGVTLETALTITNERITAIAETDDGAAPTLILDNITGATAATDNDLNYITNGDNGMMQLELSAANLNRVGRFRVTITDAANHCPVVEDFVILPTQQYDSLFAGTDVLQTHVTEVTAGLIADDVLNRNMATGTDSGSATVRTVRQALRFLRNKWDLTAGTLTVKKEDDTTTSWTGAATTDGAAVPVVSLDPASA